MLTSAPELIVPDATKPLREGALSPWAGSWRSVVMCRSSANMSPNASSATDTEFALGVFMTSVPHSAAASRSTLSSPVPARTTALRPGHARSTSPVTLVAPSTSRAFTPEGAATSSAPLSALPSLTS